MMRISSLAVLATSLLAVSLSVGCGGANTGPATEIDQDELSRFIDENPDVAAEEPEMDPTEDDED